MLTETWLDDVITDRQLFGHEYTVFRCDRSIRNSSKQSGGGVLIAVHRRHNASLVFTTDRVHVEQLWVKVSLSSKTLYLCCFYLPPDLKRDMNILNSHLSSIEQVNASLKEQDLLLICGDYNLSCIDWEYDKIESDSFIARPIELNNSIPTYATTHLWI